MQEVNLRMLIKLTSKCLNTRFLILILFIINVEDKMNKRVLII